MTWGSVYLLISFLIWKMGRAEVPHKAAVRTQWSTGLGPQSSCETGWASPSWEEHSQGARDGAKDGARDGAREDGCERIRKVGG